MFFAVDVCLAPAASFGFSEHTNFLAVAMLSPYYSRALSDEAVRLYSPRTGVTSGVFLDLQSWIAKGNVSEIACSAWTGLIYLRLSISTINICLFVLDFSLHVLIVYLSFLFQLF